MTKNEESTAALNRIADALDRLAPPHLDAGDLLTHPGYAWDGSRLIAQEEIASLPLGLLAGIDRQRDVIAENIARHAKGAAAHDMLLWGARGMGKSALVRSSVAAMQARGLDIGLVQAGGEALSSLPTLFARLASVERRFVVFLDDLGFDEDGPARQLRSLLDGGVMARAASIRIAATSNHRAVVARHHGEQPDPLAPKDALHDRLALADRFGLSVGFHECDQENYLAIVTAYAEYFGLDHDPAEALEWSRRRGGRSGRVAHQFIVEIAGREGRSLN